MVDIDYRKREMEIPIWMNAGVRVFHTALNSLMLLFADLTKAMPDYQEK